MHRFSALVQDLARAVRLFRRVPLFFWGTVLTLALGVGVNGAVFSIFQAVLLRPLPYAHPDRLVMVWRADAHASLAPSDPLFASESRWALSGEMASGWRDESRDVLSDFAAVKTWENLEAQFDLALRDRAERLRGAFVTPNFFDVLGVSAAHGRLFTADGATDESGIVLSHGLWQRDFGGDISVIGRTLPLVVGRVPRQVKTFTILGVLPAAFRFTYPDETEAWAIQTWAQVHDEGRGTGQEVVARLRPGVTVPEANARVAAIRTGLAVPSQRFAEVVRLEPITEWVVGQTRPSVWLLQGVAALLLLIACVTAANALLSRVTERERELAVRAALGADSWRLIRQLLTEGAVVALTGTALGTLLAAAIGPVLRSILPVVVPRADEVGLSIWILAFAASAAGATTVLAALVPAWRAAGVDVVNALKRTAGAVSPDRGTARWRQGLVAAQSAFATALLVSTVLLLISYWRLGHVPLGFDGHQVVTVEMRLLDQRYWPPPPAAGERGSKFSPALAAFQDNLAARLRALPGVTDVGLTSAVPFRGVDSTSLLTRVGGLKRYAANTRSVDAGYFSVMRIELVAGRLLTDRDTVTGPKVVVISESYARKMFGTANPIGQFIDFGEPVAVVGVVHDVRYVGFDQEPASAVYLPNAQWPDELVCVVLRAAPNAGDLGPAIRRVVRDIDPALPVMNLTTIDDILDQSVADRRFYTVSTTAFATLALLLTMTGLVVIVARSIVERRRELAIRAAIGASASRLTWLVALEALRPVVAGTAIGALGAVAAATVLGRFLFNVAPHNPLIYGAVVLLVTGVAAAASVVPSRRITKTPVATALRID
ncbi:MAG TPA: ABC transporter permease [Vicinamibacterales bacterium]